MSKPIEDFEKALLFLYAMQTKPRDEAQQLSWLASVAFDGDKQRAVRALQTCAARGFADRAFSQSPS